MTADRVRAYAEHLIAFERLLLFTGARLREILHAKWADIDLDRALLTVFSKTGRHVFLPPPAIAILTALPRDGEYVIPGQIETLAN